MSVPIRLERTVTLGLLVTIALQSAGALIWAGAAESRISGLEYEMNVRSDINQRLARLEGETAIVREQLQRIEDQLSAERTLHRELYRAD